MFPPSRESFRTFHELSEIFSDENNHSLSRELLIKVRGSGHPHRCMSDAELRLMLAEICTLLQLPALAALLGLQAGVSEQAGLSASPPKSRHCPERSEQFSQQR